MTDPKNRFLFSAFRAFVIRPTLKLLYRFSIEGRENLPTHGPAVLICKHQSWVDLFAVSEVMPRQMNYVAKRELFENLFGDFQGSVLDKIGQAILPFTSGGLRGMGAIPIDREHPEKMLSSFKIIRGLVKKDEFLVVFPEGRVIPDTMGEFKAGMVNLLIKMQKNNPVPIPFIPVGISYGKSGGLRKKLFVKIGKPVLFSGNESDACGVIREKVEELTDFSL